LTTADTTPPPPLLLLLLMMMLNYHSAGHSNTTYFNQQLQSFYVMLFSGVELLHDEISLFLHNKKKQHYKDILVRFMMTYNDK